MSTIARLDNLVDLIVSGLEALPGSTGTVCLASLPTTMSDFLLALQSKGRDHYTFARSRYSRLFDAFASFASTEWSDEQIQAIMTAPYTPCNCNKRQAATRETHRAITPNDPLYQPSSCLTIIISFVYCLLAGACLTIQRGKLEKNAPGKWPESAASFIPRGGDMLLRAAMRWVKATGNTAAFQALGVITRFCESLTKAILCSDEFLDLVDKRYEWFVHTLEDHKGSMITVQKGGITRREYPFKLDCMPTEVLQTLADFFYLFNEMSAGMAVGHDLFYLWLAPRAPSFYESTAVLVDLLPFIDIASHPQMKPEYTTFVFSLLGCHTHEIIPPPVPTLHPTLAAFKTRKAPLSLSALSYTMLRLFLGQIRVRAACCNATCGKTCESLGRPFEFCAGCRVVRYCSRECQKASWSSSASPSFAHKPVCKLMGKLYPLRDFGTTPDLDMEAASKLFEEKIFEIGITEEQIKQVTEHLMNLQSAFEGKKLMS